MGSHRDLTFYMFYMNILYVIGCKNIHTVLLKLYNQFYMNILYGIVCKNVHTFMKKNIWTPRVFLIFFSFFERILYKSNCIIFIFSWCGTHTKIRSKLVVTVTVGSQKITLWGPQRTPLGILRVNATQPVLLLGSWNNKRKTVNEMWKTFHATHETFHFQALVFLGPDLFVVGNDRWSARAWHFNFFFFLIQAILDVQQKKLSRNNLNWKRPYTKS